MIRLYNNIKMKRRLEISFQNRRKIHSKLREQENFPFTRRNFLSKCPLPIIIVQLAIKMQTQKIRIKIKFEARNPKFETNSNDPIPNDQNKNKCPRNTRKTRKNSS
jgi:hypothetical protein